MGILGERIAERLGNENLPRRVRQMLLGPDDVRDLEIEIIDHAGQMIEASAVGPLDDVILLAGPVEFNVAADMVVQIAAFPSRGIFSRTTPAAPRPRTAFARPAFQP